MKKSIIKTLCLVLGVGMLLTGLACPAYAAEKLPTLTSVSGWSASPQNKAQIVSGLDTEVKYEGGASFKVVSNQKHTPNVYGQLVKDIAVEKGHTYVVKFMAKAYLANGISQCWDWGTRTSCLPFGGTFDWREFQFNYTANHDGKVEFRMIFEKEIKGYWMDNFVAYDTAEPEKNLVTNGNFEAGIKVVDPNAQGGEASVEGFKAEANKIDIHNKHYPLFPAEISVDADLSDWEGMPEIYVPTAGEDVVWYEQNQPIDAYFTFKAAHDENYFYMMMDVEDDTHISENSGNYWQKDSLQVGISEMTEAFGKEIGVIHTEDVGGVVFNTASSYQIKTKREGTHTIYELALPWMKDFKNGINEGLFSGKPERFKFTVIANDNDGNGRIGCTRLSSGMDDIKSSAPYPVFEVIDKKQTWSAFAKHLSIDDVSGDVVYELGVWNNTSNVRNAVCVLKNGVEVPITAEPYSIGKAEVTINYDKPGDKTEPFKFKSGGEELNIEYMVSVLPNKAYTANLIQELKDRNKALNDLFIQCVAKGISTEYEMMYYKTVEKFISVMELDVSKEDYRRIQYTYDCLDEILIKAKTNMESYLAGTATPRLTTKYVTGDITTDGAVFMATMETDGVKEVRPAFFNGYIGYSEIRRDIEELQDFGVSSVQIEFGVYDVIFDSFFWEGYQTTNNDLKEKGFDGSNDSISSLEGNQEYVYEGDWSVKINYNLAEMPNIYRTFAQTIDVKPNTTYNVKAAGLGESNCGIQICLGKNWGDRRSFEVGAEDWKLNEWSFTTGETDTTWEIRVLVNSEGTCYMDGLSVKEEGTDKELLINGGFENYGSDDWFCVKPSAIDKLESEIARCAESNVAVHLLVSPHYWPAFTYEKFPEIRAVTEGGIGGNQYDVMHEKVREVISAYFAELLPRVAKYDSLKLICLANEPGIETAAIAGTMQPYFNEYLAWKYPDIAEMNAIYGTSYTDYSEHKLEQFKGRLSNVKQEMLNAAYHDYWEFNNYLFNDWFHFLASESKKYAPNVPVTAKPMWYLSSIDNSNERYRFQLGTNERWFSEWSDYRGNDAALYSWEIRGGIKKPMSKAIFYDYQRAYSNDPVVNSEDHMIPDAYNSFTPDERKHNSWDTWMHNFHGRTMNQAWSWVVDTWDGSVTWLSPLRRPDVFVDMAEASLDANRLGWEIKAVMDKKADVAVFYSDTARFYRPAHLQAVYKAYEGFYYNGHKTDILVEKYLGDTINNYDVVVVPYVVAITEENLNDLYEYQKNGGTIIILGDESLKTDVNYKPYADTTKIDEIYKNAKFLDIETGYDNVAAPRDQEIADFVAGVAKDKGLEKVVLVNADTGERVYNTEYDWAIYEDDIVINTCYYEYDQKMNIKVLVNGQEVTDLTELRSTKDYEGTIPVEAWRPVFIRANGAAELIK